MVRTRGVGRLGLGSRSHVVGRLGSRVWVSASFQIFALTTGRKCPRWEGELSGWGEMSYSWGICPRGNVQRAKCPTPLGHVYMQTTPADVAPQRVPVDRTLRRLRVFPGGQWSVTRESVAGITGIMRRRHR